MMILRTCTEYSYSYYGWLTLFVSRDIIAGSSDDEELQDATLASISNIAQYDNPEIRTMTSLKSIISRIESGDTRYVFPSL